MKNNQAMLQLDGWSFLKDDYKKTNGKGYVSDHLSIKVVIDKETYYALHYLLMYAAEKHDNFQQIKDAVHLAEQLQSHWENVLEEIEQELTQE